MLKVLSWIIVPCSFLLQRSPGVTQSLLGETKYHFYLQKWNTASGKYHFALHSLERERKKWSWQLSILVTLLILGLLTHSSACSLRLHSFMAHILRWTHRAWNAFQGFRLEGEIWRERFEELFKALIEPPGPELLPRPSGGTSGRFWCCHRSRAGLRGCCQPWGERVSLVSRPLSLFLCPHSRGPSRPLPAPGPPAWGDSAGLESLLDTSVPSGFGGIRKG